jgi:hypothetical protein
MISLDIPIIVFGYLVLVYGGGAFLILRDRVGIAIGAVAFVIGLWAIGQGLWLLEHRGS